MGERLVVRSIPEAGIIRTTHRPDVIDIGGIRRILAAGMHRALA